MPAPAPAPVAAAATATAPPPTPTATPTPAPSPAPTATATTATTTTTTATDGLRVVLLVPGLEQALILELLFLLLPEMVSYHEPSACVTSLLLLVFLVLLGGSWAFISGVMSPVV